MRVITIISALMITVMTAVTASAQIKIVPRDKVNAVANPRLSADSAALDFDVRNIVAGRMREDDGPKTFRYRFTNVSEETVVIRRLVSSCSCANAMCAVREIAPRASSEICVRYDPAGHPGRFERRIFVYTQDGNAPSAVLRLSVDVESGPDMSSEWPVQMGTIRLRRTEVSFDGCVKAVETLRFINAGDCSLSLKCESGFLPGCLSCTVEPDVTEPGQEGMIRIAFDPSKPGVRRNMKVILKGLGLPPSKSAITIVIPSEVEESE